MKNLPIISITLAALCWWSCNNGPGNQPAAITKSDSVKKEGPDYYSMIDSMAAEQAGAAIGDTVTVVKTFNLSEPERMDTFILTVEPGKLKESKSHMVIISAAGKEIYRQDFGNLWFGRNAFWTDSVPNSVAMDDRPLWNYNYAKSVRTEDVVRRARKEMATIFDDIFLDMNEFRKYQDNTPIKDEYRDMLNDSTLKLMLIPCYDCEEGGSYLAWSAKEGKVVTIGEVD